MSFHRLVPSNETELYFVFTAPLVNLARITFLYFLLLFFCALYKKHFVLLLEACLTFFILSTGFNDSLDLLGDTRKRVRPSLVKLFLKILLPDISG